MQEHYKFARELHPGFASWVFRLAKAGQTVEEIEQEVLQIYPGLTDEELGLVRQVIEEEHAAAQEEKGQIDVEPLGSIVVGGVSFQKGDNSVQLFYDTTDSAGRKWHILSPHGAPRPYWTAVVEGATGALLCLTSSIGNRDGSRDKDILYDLWASEADYQDPPMPLLRAIAAIIRSGADPWEIDAMPEDIQRIFLGSLGIAFPTGMK